MLQPGERIEMLYAEGMFSVKDGGVVITDTRLVRYTDNGHVESHPLADVSAVADPNTGVDVYDTYCDINGCGSGWMVFGGTSVASPIVGSVYALAGNAASVNYGSYPYSHTSSLNDVTSGSNGRP